MKRTTYLAAAVVITGYFGCSEESAPALPPSRVQLTLASVVPSSPPGAPVEVPGSPAKVSDFSLTGVTLAVAPDPVVLCEKTGLGQATVSWNAKNFTSVEVRVDAPNGALFARGGGTGSARTEKWVSKDTVFYLQDASKDGPQTAGRTLARLQPKVVPGACD